MEREERVPGRLTRRELLRALAVGAAGAASAALASCGATDRGTSTGTNREEGRTMAEAKRGEEAAAPSRRMPVLFVGHGSPMNLIEDNEWSRGFAALGKAIPRPSAILCVSAHWFVEGTYLTGAPRPKTIHDFHGFPPELYEIDYPAPGHADLAKRVRTILGEERATLRNDWGLDHGSWSVLRWMYPEADIPVVQLSLHRKLAPEKHLDLGRSLAPLREEGVLILGSGNLVHNLRDAFQRMRAGPPETPDWARRFDETLAKALEGRDTKKLASLWPDTDDGRRAHPSPDHFLPILYAYAATDDADAVRFPVTGFDMGSVSMRNVVFG